MSSRRRRKSSGQWIAIVTVKIGKNDPYPAVIETDKDVPHVFQSVSEIREMKDEHILCEFDWVAYNFLTAETEVL